MRRLKYCRFPLLAVALLLLCAIKAKATDDPPIVKYFSGYSQEFNLATDPWGTLPSDREVVDDIFYNFNSSILNPANDQITNSISLIVDEEKLYLLSGSETNYTASLKFRVEYVLKNGTTGSIPDYTLQVSYRKGQGVIYDQRQTLKFDNCRKVKIFMVANGFTTNDGTFGLVLRLENRMSIKRDYVFNHSNSLTPTHAAPAPKADELAVSWSANPNDAKGKTHVDLEWTWIDDEAQNAYKTSGNWDANLIFLNNSSRITTESKLANSYKVPMIYDGAGFLFYRIRPVQYLESGQVVNGEWSTGTSFTFLQRIAGDGHEESLNWQTTTSFAEDGKRKTVVQYFDGTLRGRQTVTKDNVSNKTVVAETFYDYQGRPAVNILPAPTMSTVIGFTNNFNKFEGSFVTPKDAFDIIPVGNLCNFTTPRLDKNHTSGAAVYYSPNNPEKDLGINKFIPDADGYAYTETRYTPDATGRIAAQSGVGATHQLGKPALDAHDTKYFYGKPDQKELDALFGNEAGDATHYFKNMVRDANGQYSVSYVDMHGRTVATALAGNVPENVKAIASYAGGVRNISKNLLSPTNNRIEGRSVVMTTTLLVTNDGPHTFNYTLTPRSAEILDCQDEEGETICYDCYYNLEIRITNECGFSVFKVASNLNFLGGVPQTDMSCSTTANGITLSFVSNMAEGEYNITKKLTVNKSAQDYYREQLFKPHNICRTLQTFYSEILTTLQATSNCNITCEQCNTALGEYGPYRTAFLTQQGIDPATVVPYEAEIRKSYDEAKAQCTALCSTDKKNVLGSIRQAMLEDMTPEDGQYARIDVDLNNNNVIDGAYNTALARWEKYSNRAYNIFKAGELNYTKPKGENGQLFYMDELGQAVTAPADQEGFIRDFQPSWANSLITYHPEYCKLVKAETSLKASYEKDYLVEQIDTWAAASAFTSGDGTAIVNTDPFFSGVGSGYKTTMIQYVKTNFNRYNVNNANPPNTLWKAAWMTVFCNYDNSNTNTCGFNAPLYPSQFQAQDPNCTGDWNEVWRVFRTLYLSEKERMVNLWLEGQCGGNNLVNTLIANKYEIRFGKPESYYNSTSYMTGIVNNANNNQGGAAQTIANQQLQDQYEDNCESYKAAWISRLMQCDVIAQKPQAVRDAILNDITEGLTGVCIAGSDIDHPMGSSTAAPLSTYTPKSFQVVIKNVFDAYTIPVSALCHYDLIDFPQPYHMQIPVADEVVIETKDACVCARLTTLQNEKTALGYDGSISLSAFIEAQHGITISQTLINQLLAGCTGICNFYDPPVRIPAFLSCNTPLKNCITCHEYDSLKTIFKATFPPLSNGVLYPSPGNDNELNANKAFAMFMNNRTGFNKTWYEYLAFEQNCSNWQTRNADTSNIALMPALPKLCTTETMFPHVEIPDDCNSDLATLALNMAMEQYDVYVTQQYAMFDDVYLKKCLEAKDHETFTVDAPVAEYHYTLYYYDQAGNLVKTVPPAGVVATYQVPFGSTISTYSQAFFDLVKEKRDDPQLAPVLLQHNLPTQYRYNSLNQVMKQYSPDGGISRFWYDALGRLVLSQNQKQFPETFSYTRYDGLGRITEVGEKYISQGPNDIPINQDVTQGLYLDNFLVPSTYSPNNSITRTVYDEAYTPVCTDNYLCQQNLRNRVSYSYVLDQDDGSTPPAIPWSSATFYSYDIHGNINVLLQDYNKGMGQIAGGNRYKKMVYKYDLVSGKVNEVAYQPGYADAFYHAYKYDAENKLTETFTSKDYIHWVTDARYTYYRHGPLARTVLGDQKVQGVDYAYTLQGWLKGVNSTGMGSGTITGDGTDCENEAGGFENLIVNARLHPFSNTYKAKTSIEFVSGFESTSTDKFETFLEPSLETCGTTGTTGSNTESGGNVFDMGQDGDGTAPAYPAIYGNRVWTKDAYGFSLNYFNGDYNRISSAAPNPFATINMAIPTGDAGNAQTAQPLYNGNIGAMAVSIPKLSGTRLYGYNYDQLNRITNMHAFKGFNSSDNTFTPQAMPDYKEKVSYDANGNILTYRRNGVDATIPGAPGGLDMDDLGYEYYAGSNRLRKVTDNIANTGNYPNDIDNQTALYNYEYDQIGNLVRDHSEGIEIQWTVYGKISAIYKYKDNISSSVIYTYDAAGNRISKRVQKNSSEEAYTMTYYVRDASGNVMSVYTDNDPGYNNGHLTQTEIHLYGSSRLGIYKTKTDVETENRVYVSITGATNDRGEVLNFARGKTFYELSNHLGNVLATVSDKRIPVIDGSISICEGAYCYNPIMYYLPDVVSASDYYPFGMNMPGRNFSSDEYRYGFNGKENDKDAGKGIQDYGLRIYDRRLGKFLSVDPLGKSFPWNSSYAFAEDDVMRNVDLDGGEKKPYAGPTSLPQIGKAKRYDTEGGGNDATYYTVKEFGQEYKITKITVYEEIRDAFGQIHHFNNYYFVQDKSIVNESNTPKADGSSFHTKGTNWHYWLSDNQGMPRQFTQTVQVAEGIGIGAFGIAFVTTGGFAAAYTGGPLLGLNNPFTGAGLGKAIAGGAGDLLSQITLTPDKKVNWWSVGANALFSNPFTSAAVASSAEYRVGEGIKLTDVQTVATNTVINGTFGAFNNKIFGELAPIKLASGSENVIRTIGSTIPSYWFNTAGSAASNGIIEASSTPPNEIIEP